MRSFTVLLLLLMGTGVLFWRVEATVPVRIADTSLDLVPQNPAPLDVQTIAVDFADDVIVANVTITFIQAPVQMQFEPYTTDDGRVALRLLRTRLLNIPLLPWQVDVLDTWLRDGIAAQIHTEFESRGLVDYEVVSIDVSTGTISAEIHAPVYQLVTAYIQGN